MNEILIADAGSSKTKWSLLSSGAPLPMRISSEGINPLHDDPVSIEEKLHQVWSFFHGHKIEKVYFFGAGCAFEAIKDNMASLIKKKFQCQNAEVESDLYAASLALFGEGEGIACILGTGSNSCVFSEGKIVAKTPSLGYLLGDEGGGVSLGRQLLNAIFKHRLPKEIIAKFQDEYHLSIEELLNKVYLSEKAASFIASFSPFLLKNIDTEEIRIIVEKEFERFIVNNISPYKSRDIKNIGFVGSIAFNFASILKSVVEKNGFILSEILKDPLPSLEQYYSVK